MKTPNNFQMKFWRLAGFNCFIVSYCPTIYNRVAGIGLHYLLQLILVFISASLAFSHLPGEIFTGLPIASLMVWVACKSIKTAISIQHRHNNRNFLTIAFIANIFFAVCISLPFCITMFQNEIDFAFALHPDDNPGFIGIALRPVKGILLAGEDLNQSFIIRLCCAAIITLTFYCCFIPYLLAYQTLGSIHNTVFNSYERHFKRRG